MCTYCAFNTYADLAHLVPDFLTALNAEIRYLGQTRPALAVKSIFFGGGTPSLLTPDQFQRLFEALHDAFEVAEQAEISLEANPNDLNRAYLRALRRLGFNRISIGMQSASPRDLRLFNRRHDQGMVVAAVAAARAAGFENINLDLIYSIPGQTLADWEATLTQALALEPDHFSLYDLELKHGTPLRTLVEDGFAPTPDDDLAADMYDLATDMLAPSHPQYEISNWSRPGYESQHNLQYWRSGEYLGLGPGAHGLAAGMRYSQMILPQRYIAALDDTLTERAYPRTPATAKAIALDPEAAMNEAIMMGLRLTREGLSRAAFWQRFGVDLVQRHRATIDKFVGYGLLEVDDEALRLTQAGRFLSNAILREML